MKKMKPILFNTEMVQAILEGRKTVTRRCIKGLDPEAKFGGWLMDSGNEKSYGTAHFEIEGRSQNFKLRYLTGDIVYVRETWDEVKNNDGSHLRYVYRATDAYPFRTEGDELKFKWKPSIHMPKKAARLFLRITDVRIERLHDMLGSDCVKEGIRTFTKDGKLDKYAVSIDWWDEFHSRHKSFKGTSWQAMPTSIFEAFSYLWDSPINKKELYRYGWNADPWVGVYEFEVISKEEAMKESEK